MAFPRALTACAAGFAIACWSNADPSASRPATAEPAAQSRVTNQTLAATLADLQTRRLTVPVAGITPSQLVGSFDLPRGSSRHEAIDIMAPRGTPVLAVEDGRVAKLFESRTGGRTLYQFDPAERVAYYYAHLDRYADGILQGQALKRGQTIGYVGTTGNADPSAPHLHFAIFVLGPERRWWEGTPLDPHAVLTALTAPESAHRPAPSP